ncbi:unnamed protein product [Rotaria sp. Silwood1]|nr:unnamed protein product [Rotaria sp. Silwood1]
MTEQMEQLRIIAQPKAFFRERYGSELDQAENTAKRYIRAEDNNQLNLEYPTIEISGTWYGTIDHPYIRVASVTVPNENVSMAYEAPADPVITTNGEDKKFAICAPEKGNWAGGDNILMVLNKVDRKKGAL